MSKANLEHELAELYAEAMSVDPIPEEESKALKEISTYSLPPC